MATFDPTTTIALYTDGLCEPRNPGGYACWAWVALSPAGAQLKSAHGCLGHGPGMTNNLAEYEAVLQALRYAVTRRSLLKERGLSLELRADSQLVVRQIAGEYRTNKAELVPLRDEARSLLDQLNVWHPTQIVWVPREHNTVADGLTRRAYDAARRATPIL